jgi:hypothetical protein
MGIISPFKVGDCSRCPAQQAPCVKRGKVLLCLNCAKAEKTEEYMQAAMQKRQLLRSPGLSRPKMLNISIQSAFASADPELQKWYEMVATFIMANPHCMECDTWIAPGYYKAASAHIFPKEEFPSVKYHPLNFLILGAACGCHQRSHTIDKFKKMQVWPIAAKRYELFAPEILETHKFKTLFEQAMDENKTHTKNI